MIARACAGMVIGLAPSLLVGQSAARQLGATLGVEAASVALRDYAPASVVSALAVAQGGTERLHFAAGASASRFETGHGSSYATVQGSAKLLGLPTTAIAWDAEAAGGTYRGARASEYAMTGARVTQRLGAHASLWGSGGIGQARDIVSYGTMHAMAGVEAHQRAVGLEASAAAIRGLGVTYADLTGRLTWAAVPLEHARIGLESASVTAGARSGVQGPGANVWLQGTLSIRVASRLALVMSEGTLPADLLRAARGVRYASAGLQLRLGSSRWSNRDASRPVSPTASSVMISGEGADRTRMLTLRVPGASDVEISGDFTAWEPVRMQRAGGDLWTVRIPLSAGVHHANIRTPGGEWGTIPSLPVASGDFGPVSVFVVP